MTNKDFWTSINTIITDGFTPKGLKNLEVYADLFISGKLIYKRFSPFEQHGCTNGGVTHVIASLLSGAEIGTDKLTAPEGSFKREQQRAKTQTTIIEQWAKATGCWINNVDDILSKNLGLQIAEGGEAHVYEQVCVKISFAEKS